MKYGEDWELENQATEMIMRARRASGWGSGGQTLPDGVLSEDQWKLRNQRELLTESGSLDEQRLRPGVYSRAHAFWPRRPHQRHHLSRYMDPWRQFSYEWYDGGAQGTFRPAGGDSALKLAATAHVSRWGVERDPLWAEFNRRGKSKSIES